MKTAVIFSLLFPMLALSASEASVAQLPTLWTGGGAQKELKLWNLGNLGAVKELKKRTGNERDPSSGKVVRWEGVLFSELIEKSLDSLAPDQKAQVDLIVLYDKSGQRTFMPRSLVVKYPFLVSKGQGQAFSVVVPWTSHPKVQQEGLPIERYFLNDLTKVELTSYREKYSPAYLKKRTDPSAMRGQKIFVQSCLSCHGPAGQGASVTLTDLGVERRVSTVASNGHPEVKGMSKVGAPEIRALKTYLEAFQSENSTR